MTLTKGERTRQHIIETAAPLFNRNGFRGCSMSDIMEATGLEKGGIYRHFESKESLAVEVLRSSLRQSVKLHAPDLHRFATAREKILFVIDHFVETPSVMPGGCPLMNAAVDSDDGNVPMRKLVKGAFADWKERMIAVLDEGFERGEFSSEATAPQLADTIIATLEGAQVLARVQGSRDSLRSAQTVLHLLIESMSLKKKNNRAR